MMWKIYLITWTLIAVVGAVVILNVELSDPSAFIFGIIWFGSVLLGVTHTLRSRSIKSGQANIKKNEKSTKPQRGENIVGTAYRRRKGFFRSGRGGNQQTQISLMPEEECNCDGGIGTIK